MSVWHCEKRRKGILTRRRNINKHSRNVDHPHFRIISKLVKFPFNQSLSKNYIICFRLALNVKSKSNIVREYSISKLNVLLMTHFVMHTRLLLSHSPFVGTEPCSNQTVFCIGEYIRFSKYYDTVSHLKCEINNALDRTDSPDSLLSKTNTKNSIFIWNAGTSEHYR